MPVIAHNIASQFTNRQLNITTNKKGKSAEKLSSGYKINRSADDAAGLQISEKMRSQIRGLNQASRNIQDGISLCQVADGALNETHGILQRMRELSVQAANDTNQEIDREAIQAEIEELTKEVDRIATDTSFNDGIYPLLGNKEESEIQPFQSISYNPADLISGTECIIKGDAYGIPISTLGFYSFNYETAENAEKFINAMNNIHMDYQNKYTVSTWRIDGAKAYLDIRQTDIDSTAMYNCICNGTVPASELTVAEGSCTVLNDGTYKLDFGDTWGYVIIGRTSGLDIPEAINQNAVLKAYYNTAKNGLIVSNRNYILSNQSSNNDMNQQLWIQMGANSGQGIFLGLVNATAKGVGITDPTLDVTSYDNANTSISRLDNAINRVSGYRSHFGAQQNRLECAKAVDDNTAENTQYAESRIRDTDMAEEMVEHSKNNILEQVGQSMLAQANQSTQGILSLLG